MRQIKLPYSTKTNLIKKLKKENLYTEKVQKALEISSSKHKTQKRDHGTPYCEEHIYPIVLDLFNAFKPQSLSEDIVIVALLHDSIEDTNYKFNECKKDFGKFIADQVMLLTKSKKENEGEYSVKDKLKINQKALRKAEKNKKVALIVKYADRYNNLSSLVDSKNLRKYNRYMKEVEEFYVPSAEKYSKYYYDKLTKKLNQLKKLSV